MAQPPQTIRIFISSPGDVAEEREGARRVIEGLQRLYPAATLRPVLWEELALPVTASFQETIDFLLEREPIDIAVFILWSRLGSPLGAAVARADGSPYRSGTEREFDLMLTAFEQSGRKKPLILAYVRDDDTGFKRKLADCPKSQLPELIEQQQMAESFIVEQFHDAEGRNLRAYQTYHEPFGFTQRLRVHLRRALDDLLDTDHAATWSEEPYRGLETFDIEHAPIFHGRDEETCELLQRLRDQQQDGCAFVVIVAASGAGKSSLARAGVAASLMQQAVDHGGESWKVSSFIPTLADQGLCHALVRSLGEVLPDLTDSEDAVNTLAEGLAENAALTTRLTITPAFARAEPPARLLLILDQMEELWTDRHTTETDREVFLAAVEALARSGHVAVLATLRSDFYHHAQASPTFLRLKGKLGHYDLLPPDAASIHRLITEPARLAGLKFEQNETTGRSLDEVILDDASHDPQALPLLEYTLSELYRQRDGDRRLMTFAAYVELGGVEGAIGKRADETFANLPADAQEALDEILPLLVSVDVAGQQAAVRRRASIADLTSTPARTTLTGRLIEQRFLTTDREGETPVASLAHEALLRSWDRIVGWINANREQLRLRARVEQQQQRWQQQERDDSLLLAEGLPLDEGRQLLEKSPHLLSEATREYITASIEHHDQKSKRSRRVRTAVLSTIAVLMVALTGGGVVAWRINEETKRKAALEQRAAEAEGLVRRLLDVETSGLKDAIKDLAPYQDLARESLANAYENSKDGSKAKLHAGLARVGEDDSLLPYLKEQLLDVTPAQFGPIRELLDDQKDDLTEYYWGIVEDLQEEDDRRFQAACALAAYDSKHETWEDPKFTQFVADHLVGVLPSELVPWRSALEPVQEQLVAALGAIFRDTGRGEQERSFATDTLADYTSDDSEALFELLMDAEPKQFAALFDGFAKYGDQAIAKLDNEINRVLEPSWDDPPLDPAWTEPEEQLVEKIEQADGMVAERFAFCQTLPMDEFQSVADQLSRSGYRPIRLRPYMHDDKVRAAAAWTRDGRDWRFATSDSAESMLGQDESMRKDGFVAVDVAGFLAGIDRGVQEQYAGVWIKQQSDDEDARVYVGVPYARHKEAYGELEEAGYKFQHSLQGFRSLNGQQKYCGVKAKASGSGSWSWDLSLSQLDGKLYLDKVHWDIDPSRSSDPETTQQRNEKLLADAEARLQEKPDDLQARFDRAKARFSLGHNDEALADMGYLVQNAPNFAATYQYRSILYARMGDADAARMDLQHFDRRSTSEAIKVYLDVVVAAHLGEESEAVKRLEERVDQNRGDDGVLYDAACAYSVAAGVYQGQDDDKAGRYADRSVALLGQAIAAGYSNYSHIQEDADLDSIRQHRGFAELMNPANLGLRFSAVWNTSTRLESQASHGLSPSEHLDQCREWLDQGYRLVSISAASVDGDLVTASVWHRPLIARGAREMLAKRQANAASAMARLAQTGKLFPVLRIHDDPESLTQFVHRCREEGVTPRQLLACLELADRGRQALRGDARQIEDRILFGLLLALGEFNLDELPADKQQITVEQVGRWYDQDASSAIHGAAGWLLRRWGQTDLVRQVDETAREYDPEREWFTLAIETDDQTFYQTYVVVPPGEYTLGSPPDEPERDSDERLNLVRLTRPVAILDREITRGEFEASGVAKMNIDDVSPTPLHPMAAPSWYYSVQYCRWLTEQAGFGEADQAYPNPSTLNASQFPRDGEADYPKNWPLNRDAPGFRLPTEAEWEIAARAGMGTVYSFGGDTALLDQYGWFQSNSGQKTHVAKQLRPNLRGLFDMHGNVYEWCHDWYDVYPVGSVRDDPVGSTSGSSRVYRGGSWSSTARYLRSANRIRIRPSSRDFDLGFRVAAVLSSESSQEAESGSKQSDRAQAEP